MRHVVVRYKVKAGRTAENEKLVRAVYDELRRAQPGGFRYATLTGDDGTFVHLARLEDDSPAPLPELSAFQVFLRDIEDRCDEPPMATEMRVVESYRLFGDE